MWSLLGAFALVALALQRGGLRRGGLRRVVQATSDEPLFATERPLPCATITRAAAGAR